MPLVVGSGDGVGDVVGGGSTASGSAWTHCWMRFPRIRNATATVSPTPAPHAAPAPLRSVSLKIPTTNRSTPGRVRISLAPQVRPRLNASICRLLRRYCQPVEEAADTRAGTANQRDAARTCPWRSLSDQPLMTRRSPTVTLPLRAGGRGAAVALGA